MQWPMHDINQTELKWDTPYLTLTSHLWRVLNTLRPRQNGRRFADHTFKRIFLNENARISIKISLKFVPKGPINHIPTLVQIMAWRRSGDKPLSESMMVSLLTHICVTRPQWVNDYIVEKNGNVKQGFDHMYIYVFVLCYFILMVMSVIWL